MYLCIYLSIIISLAISKKLHEQGYIWIGCRKEAKVIPSLVILITFMAEEG